MTHHEFSYPSTTVSINGRQMHYVDWGQQENPAVVLLHGNYSWAYSFRHFIPHLTEAGFRCVVPDHIGFGRSDKPTDVDIHTFDFHKANLEAFIMKLELEDLVLIGQEWGGVMGLDYATSHQENLKALVLMNSGPFLTARSSLWSRVSANSFWGDMLVRRLGLGLKGIYPDKRVYYKENLDQSVKTSYSIPFPDYASRAGILGFLRMSPLGKGDSEWAPFKAIQDKLLNMDVPTLLIGSRQDPSFGISEARALERLLPNSELRTLDDAGALLQEDRPDLLSRWIVDFLSRLQPKT